MKISRPGTHSLRAAGLLLAASILLGGCISHAPSYSVRTRWPQKDVAIVSVHVEGKLSAKEYLRIVEREQAGLLAHREGAIIPVYEMRFQFMLEDESSPLAEVSIVSGLDESSGEVLFASPRVVIY